MDFRTRAEKERNKWDDEQKQLKALAIIKSQELEFKYHQQRLDEKNDEFNRQRLVHESNQTHERELMKIEQDHQISINNMELEKQRMVIRANEILLESKKLGLEKSKAGQDEMMQLMAMMERIGKS